MSFCVSEQDELYDSSVHSLSDDELNKLIQDASKKMRSAKIRDVDNDDDGDYNYRVSESAGEGTCRMCLAHVQTHDLRDQRVRKPLCPLVLLTKDML